MSLELEGIRLAGSLFPKSCPELNKLLAALVDSKDPYVRMVLMTEINERKGYANIC